MSMTRHDPVISTIGPRSGCDVLIVSEVPLWPLDQGLKVHGSQMAKALTARGQRVRIATLSPPPDDMPDDLRRLHLPWPEASDADARMFRAGWNGPLGDFRAKVASHQALSLRELAGLVPLVRRCRPAAAVALGQHGPILLRGLHGYTRRMRERPRLVWYAADELVSFQLGCWMKKPWSKPLYHARLAAVYAGIERAFGPCLDGVIGVSPRDTQRLKWMTAARSAKLIRNGVDLDFFNPAISAPSVKPRSLVFWGRLDFEPNVDAACWFVRHVWPTLRFRFPDATLSIVGCQPTPAVKQLDQHAGVTVVGPVDDLRPHAMSASATILPMRVGGGIKNKLLEAAAMGLPIIASPRAVAGLDLGGGRLPLEIAKSKKQWIDSVRRVWTDDLHRQSVGEQARTWAQTHHNWDAAAEELIQWTSKMQGNGLRPMHSSCDDAKLNLAA